MTDANPVAVDPSYKLRDNQFWYSDCTFASVIRGQRRITLSIEGLGIRTLEHSEAGKDGRPTLSFKFPSSTDSRWWKTNRGKRIRLELLSVDGEPSPEPEATPEAPARLGSSTSSPPPKQSAHRVEIMPARPASGSTLCIGLDIAWYGGSAQDSDSQYDCVASTNFADGLPPRLNLRRVRLANRDPDATLTLAAILEQVNAADKGMRVIVAVDAPIQASPRPHLPARAAAQAKGQAGNIERRACEDELSLRRQEVDANAGGANGWHPNIQAGAPLAPRVEKLLAGLQAAGFVLWTPETANSDRLVIECFPAEAIWAAKRLGGYPDAMTATQAKAYKGLRGTTLSARVVRQHVAHALCGFSMLSGDAGFWHALMAQATQWLLDDRDWRDGGSYRGGKLLDDVVDTMICLASAIGYDSYCAHVWRDKAAADDGHIIGPGCGCAAPWVSANQGQEQQ